MHTGATNGPEAPIGTVGWKHIVAVRTTTGRILYINGVAVSSDSVVNSISNNNAVSYGGCQDNQPYSDSTYKLGSARWYIRALSTAEVLQNFNLERSRYGV